MILEEMFEKQQYVSDPGSRYRDVFTPSIAKDGQIELVVTGKEDLVELMNSYKDSCDPTILAERFLAGDETALRQGNPAFMDLLGAPKTLAEAYQLNFRAEAAFEKLPAEVKSKFENNYYKFVESAGSPEWYNALKFDQEKPAAEEVKE